MFDKRCVNAKPREVERCGKLDGLCYGEITLGELRTAFGFTHYKRSKRLVIELIQPGTNHSGDVLDIICPFPYKRANVPKHLAGDAQQRYTIPSRDIVTDYPCKLWDTKEMQHRSIAVDLGWFHCWRGVHVAEEKTHDVT